MARITILMSAALLLLTPLAMAQDATAEDTDPWLFDLARDAIAQSNTIDIRSLLMEDGLYAASRGTCTAEILSPSRAARSLSLIPGPNGTLAVTATTSTHVEGGVGAIALQLDGTSADGQEMSLTAVGLPGSGGARPEFASLVLIDDPDQDCDLPAPIADIMADLNGGALTGMQAALWYLMDDSVVTLTTAGGTVATIGRPAIERVVMSWAIPTAVESTTVSQMWVGETVAVVGFDSTFTSGQVKMKSNNAIVFLLTEDGWKIGAYAADVRNVG